MSLYPLMSYIIIINNTGQHPLVSQKAISILLSQHVLTNVRHSDTL